MLNLIELNLFSILKMRDEIKHWSLIFGYKLGFQDLKTFTETNYDENYIKLENKNRNNYIWHLAFAHQIQYSNTFWFEYQWLIAINVQV